MRSINYTHNHYRCTYLCMFIWFYMTFFCTTRNQHHLGVISAVTRDVSGHGSRFWGMLQVIPIEHHVANPMENPCPAPKMIYTWWISLKFSTSLVIRQKWSQWLGWTRAIYGHVMKTYEKCLVVEPMAPSEPGWTPTSLPATWRCEILNSQEVGWNDQQIDEALWSTKYTEYTKHWPLKKRKHGVCVNWSRITGFPGHLPPHSTLNSILAKDGNLGAESGDHHPTVSASPKFNKPPGTQHGQSIHQHIEANPHM